MLKENKTKFELVILKWAYVPAVLIPFFARDFTHVPQFLCVLARLFEKMSTVVTSSIWGRFYFATADHIKYNDDGRNDKTIKQS